MVLMTLHAGQEQRCRTCERDGGWAGDWDWLIYHARGRWPVGTCWERRELSSEPCDDLGVGWEGARGAQREGMCVHTQLIHCVVQRKLTNVVKQLLVVV